MKLIAPSKKLWTPRHSPGAGFFGGSRLGVAAAGTPLTKSDGTPIVCSDNVTPAVANGTDGTGCCHTTPPTCSGCTATPNNFILSVTGSLFCSCILVGNCVTPGTNFGAYEAWSISTIDGTYCMYADPPSGTSVAACHFWAPMGTSAHWQKFSFTTNCAGTASGDATYTYLHLTLFSCSGGFCGMTLHLWGHALSGAVAEALIAETSSGLSCSGGTLANVSLCPPNSSCSNPGGTSWSSGTVVATANGC